MKRNILISLICLLSMQVHALIVNVEGYGPIPAEEGLSITIDETTFDILSGERMMSIEGTLLSNDSLIVLIAREEFELKDEFCCAGECTSGNGEQVERLNFLPGGVVNWFVHYYPAPGSVVMVNYTFLSGGEYRQLRVTYDASSTADVEEVKPQEQGVQKVLQDGIIYILKDNKKYTIL